MPWFFLPLCQAAWRLAGSCQPASRLSYFIGLHLGGHLARVEGPLAGPGAAAPAGPSTLPPLLSCLLYLSPLLLNGLLWLIAYLKQKNSRYTQVAQGLGFLSGLLGVALLLNTAVGVGELRYGFWLPGVLHLALVLLVVGALSWSWFKGSHTNRHEKQR